MRFAFPRDPVLEVLSIRRCKLWRNLLTSFRMQIGRYPGISVQRLSFATRRMAQATRVAVDGK
jgi:hypothetical protein